MEAAEALDGLASKVLLVLFRAIPDSSITTIWSRHWYRFPAEIRPGASLQRKEENTSESRSRADKCHNLETIPCLPFEARWVFSTAFMALGGNHTLPGFDRSLDELRADILLMATLVLRSLNNARKGFVQRDEDYCSAVIADDEEVDLLEKQVDRAGTSVLIRFQPLASDFRTVLATIKLASLLENISDQSVTIARRTRTLIQERTLEADDGLARVFEQVDDSFAEVLEAFSVFDCRRAEKLLLRMEPLAQSARELMEKFSDAVGRDPERSALCVNLIIMARSLEQIIYLIESITEDIIYVAEAKDIRHPENRLAVETN
jgi:phosphate transport system protein